MQPVATTLLWLVLAAQTAKGLETLDRIVRASIRKRLKLPKDTLLAFFHAKARDGGLGVPRLRHTISYLQSKRPLIETIEVADVERGQGSTLHIHSRGS